MRTKTRVRYKPKLSRTDVITGYCMLVPAMLSLFIFVLYPLFDSIRYSFTDWNFYGESEFIGLKNYYLALNNRINQKAYANVLRFMMYMVPLNMVLPFLTALLLKKLRGTYSAFAKTGMYIPSIISGVVTSCLFVLVLDFQGGMVNAVIRNLGGKRIDFFSRPNRAMWAIIITSIWQGLGSGALYNLAGLNAIPDSYYEAAALDGANKFQQMIFITIPSMKNILVLCLVNNIKGVLMMLELPKLMTGGGPNNSTITPVMYVYNSFSDAAINKGYMLACSILVLIFSSVLSSVVFFLIKSDKSTE